MKSVSLGVSTYRNRHRSFQTAMKRFLERSYTRQYALSASLAALVCPRWVTGKSITYAEPPEASAWRQTSAP